MKSAAPHLARLNSGARAAVEQGWFPRRWLGLTVKTRALIAQIAQTGPSDAPLRVEEDEHATSVLALPGWHGGIHFDELQASEADEMAIAINPTTGLPYVGPGVL